MPSRKIEGLSLPISRLVMGVDNQPDLSYASSIFDAYIEQGGNCFDTAYVYGREHLLGQWMARRGIRDKVVVIGKGAHTPDCDPESVTRQLMISLDRMQTDYVDIYFLHRDNTDVPVGEFVDVLNEHVDAGRMKIYGGSNWTIDRIVEADAYACQNRKAAIAAISNQFSLARMVSPPGEGCLSQSDPESIAWHHRTQKPLFAWSSQARGFFVEGRAHPDIRDDPEMVRCLYSEDNFKRLDRARKLADDMGVEPVNIALAYVLHQSFPVYALFGPRTLQEMYSSLAALKVNLTEGQVQWLNLSEL